MVHQHVLDQSPVFARMTAGGFSQSITKEILLPEEDEDTFGRVIEIFYGNHDIAFDFDSYDDSGAIVKLVDMFVVADKYQLSDLQAKIVNKIEAAQLLKENGMTFFNTASQLFNIIRDSNKIFREYFMRQAKIYLRLLTREETNQLSEMVKTGGIFAQLVFRAQAALFQGDRRKWSKERTSMAPKSAIKQRVSSTLQKNLSVAKAAWLDIPEDHTFNPRSVANYLESYHNWTTRKLNAKIDSTTAQLE